MRPKTFSQKWDREEEDNAHIGKSFTLYPQKRNWKFYLKWILIALAILIIVNLLMRYL